MENEDKPKLSLLDRVLNRNDQKVPIGALLFISTLYLLLYTVMFYMKATSKIQVDDQTFGILTGLVPVVITFWVGSSYGSKVGK